MPFRLNPFTGTFDYYKKEIRFAGQEAISNASDTVSVTFSVAMADTNYALNVSVNNTTDTDSIYLSPIITAKSTSGFTAEFNSPADSANYVLEWTAVANV